MAMFQILAQGQHGYPQPEDDFYSLVYQDYCLRCGIHGRQVAPFRLKRTQRAAHASFLQLNWVLDHRCPVTEWAVAGNWSEFKSLGRCPDKNDLNAFIYK